MRTFTILLLFMLSDATDAYIYIFKYATVRQRLDLILSFCGCCATIQPNDIVPGVPGVLDQADGHVPGVIDQPSDQVVSGVHDQTNDAGPKEQCNSSAVGISSGKSGGLGEIGESSSGGCEFSAQKTFHMMRDEPPIVLYDIGAKRSEERQIFVVHRPKSESRNRTPYEDWLLHI